MTVDTMEMDPFGIERQELVKMLNSKFADFGKVVEESNTNKHRHEDIWTIVFRKSE